MAVLSWRRIVFIALLIPALAGWLEHKGPSASAMATIDPQLVLSRLGGSSPLIPSITSRRRNIKP